MEREGGRGRGGWNSICVTEDLYHSIPPSIFLVFCDRLTRFRSRHLIGHLARPTPTLDFRWKGLKGHSAVIQSFARHCTHFFRSSCLCSQVVWSPRNVMTRAFRLRPRAIIHVDNCHVRSTAGQQKQRKSSNSTVAPLHHKSSFSSQLSFQRIRNKICREDKLARA